MKKSQSRKVSAKNGAETPQPRSQDDDDIAYCRIHPGLGIARIGNSPDEYFIGPESPGHPSAPAGGFKDNLGRVKRQAARFRIYAYNKKGEAIKELTAANATITWTAELANQKPAFEMFLGEYWSFQYPQFTGNHPLRNQEIKDPAERERLLVIKPGPRSISGANEGGQQYGFNNGTIGPLPYTVVNDRNRNCLEGSRSGYMNVAMEPPYNPSQVPAGCTWVPGELMQPVAQSPQVTVPLGELKTDMEGRLLVLGGLGQSASLISDNALGYLNEDSYYANNDYWYDDSSDGPISAKVVLKGGRQIDVKDKAWVIVAPPKYAPNQQVLTTLYEVAVEAVTKPDPKAPISFTREIYPVLSRLDGYQWVNNQAARQHGAGKVYNPLDNTPGYASASNNESLFDLLHTPGKANVDANNARTHLFLRLRTPHQLLPDHDKYKTFEDLVNSPAANKQANHSFMPQMAGDGGEPVTFGTEAGTPENQIGGTYITWLTLTPTQYRHFERWAAGDFIDDWPRSGKPPTPPLLPRLPVAEQPAALDKAALEYCVGGAFYPGIEMTYIARNPETWSGLCRINQSYTAGDITRHMALPWQADFSECKDHWWPVQRPDDVVPEAEYETFLQTYEIKMDNALAEVLQFNQPWARGISDTSPTLDNEMVEAWKEFGFVVPKTGPGDQVVYIETERSPYAGTNLRDFFYYLMNIDSYPDFLPRAHLLVEEFLAQARVNMHIAGIEGDDRYSFFEYSYDTFTARLNQIYNDYVTDNSSESGYEGGLMQTREDVIYDKIQMAPFNQLDGAWLHDATSNGPIGEVESLLFSIYMDELGDGNVEQQHCNVYTDMLKNLNIYLPEIHTREYANDERFLDSAFVEPVFLLAISQFSQDYFPEILGMTMYLEWGSIGLISVVDQLKAFNIDPQYYSLHVGIDNAASGHGALAKLAIEIFLDHVRESEGESTMREVWKRIWTGYVAFGSLGTLGQDIQNANAQRNSPQDRKTLLKTQMMDMITRKAPYASLNHRQKTLGDTYINDWFLDPAGMLDALAQGGIIIPGKPDISPIFHLMSFSGPMYHVFTDDEQKLWRDYIISLTEPDPEKPLNVVAAMRELIDYLRQRQHRNSGHNVLLTGPNPDPKSKEKYVTHSIHWWFNLNMDPQIPEPDVAFMKALSFEGSEKDNLKGNGWIVKGDASSSPLVTTMLAGGNDMAQAFGYTQPKTGGKTYKEVMVDWIDQGCPTDEVVHAAALAVAPPVVKPTKKPRRRLWGMGKVH